MSGTVSPRELLSNSLRSSKNPAVVAYQEGDIDASKEFHKRKIKDEPHKTNTIKRDHVVFTEHVLHGARNGMISSCIIAIGFYSVWSFIQFKQQLLVEFGGGSSGRSGSAFSRDSSIFSEISESLILALTVIIGVVSLVANGTSQAALHFWRRHEYIAFYCSERNREMWECENYIEGEEREMVQLYKSKGLPKDDAENLVKILSKDHNFFVDVMMKEELELLPPDNVVTPLMAGSLLFASNLIIGLLPLAPMLLSSLGYIHMPYSTLISSTLFITTLGLFACGFLQSYFSTTAWWRSGAIMVLNGVVALFIAFYLGYILMQTVF